MKIKDVYFDLDGVLRELGYEVYGEDIWNYDIIEQVNQSPSFLLNAKRSNLLNGMIENGVEYIRIITIQPELWRALTDLWISKNIRKYMDVNVLMLPMGTDKTKIIGKSWIVEDSPVMMGYDKVLVKDKPYNKDVGNVRINDFEDFMKWYKNI